MGQDPWSPLDGVNLSHQGGIDEPRNIEQTIVIPSRIVCFEHVADGVVLLDKQQMQHAQAYPPVVVETGQLKWVSLRV